MGGVTATRPSVAIVSLGCARNDVDSEELAARLESDGFDIVLEAADADAVLVNTCGFVEAAKKDSVDTLLQAAALKESGRASTVVAVGCMAERYGLELAEAMPEADAVLGFDAYPEIGARLRAVMAGRQVQSHVPRDRRTLLLHRIRTAEQKPAEHDQHDAPGHPRRSTPVPSLLAVIERPSCSVRRIRRRHPDTPRRATRELPP